MVFSTSTMMQVSHYKRKEGKPSLTILFQAMLEVQLVDDPEDDAEDHDDERRDCHAPEEWPVDECETVDPRVEHDGPARYEYEPDG